MNVKAVVNCEIEKKAEEASTQQQIRMDSNGIDLECGIGSGNPGDLYRDRAASGSRGARDRLVAPRRRS